jgi:hypothetical protein
MTDVYLTYTLQMCVSRVPEAVPRVAVVAVALASRVREAVQEPPVSAAVPRVGEV